MSTRACPFCGETIQAVAVKCRFCKESLTDDDPAPRPSGGGASVGVIVAAVVVAFCVVVGGIAVVAAIAIPNLIEARKSGNESSAIGSLKAITTAQTMHRESDQDRNGKQDYGSLPQLGQEQLIDTVLASGMKTGYRFTVGTPPAGSPNLEFEWAAAAAPVTPGTTGDRYFGVDQAGMIFYSRTAPFSVTNGTLVKPPDARPLGR